MGIDGLHNLIKSTLEECTLYKFKGMKAAIDAMSFLYKGCYSCAYELNNNIPTKSYMLILLRIVRLIKLNGIQVIIVFDGKSIKAKELTIAKRNENKQKNMEMAQQFLQDGNQVEAQKCFMRCLRVTKEMIYETMDVLRANNMDYLMAPYEADSQVAFMVRSQQVDFAITEDADLLCFGCPRVVFKLKMDSTCSYYDDSKYSTVEERRFLKSEPLRCFLSLSEQQRSLVCIMAGCDYLPSIHGIGIKTSSYLFYECKDLKSVMSKLRGEKKTKELIPEHYELFVEKVQLIFRYQRVFNMQTNQLETLNPLPEDFKSEDNKLIGEEIPYFQDIAYGKRNIDTLQPRQEKKIDMKSYFASETKWKPALVNSQSKGAGSSKQKEAKKLEDERIALAAAAIRNKRKEFENSAKKDNNNHQQLQIQDEHDYNNPQVEKDTDLNEDYLLSLLEQYQDPDIDINTVIEVAEQINESKNKDQEQEKELRIRKSDMEYLEYLCNTFVKEYTSIAAQDAVNSAPVNVVMTRNIPDNSSENTNTQLLSTTQQEQKTNGESNKEKEQLNKSVFKKNPFANSQKKDISKQLSVYQPDSLEDLNLEKVEQNIPTKNKHVTSDRDSIQMPKKVLPQIEKDGSKKLGSTLTDFFVLKKKPKVINLN